MSGILTAFDRAARALRGHSRPEPPAGLELVPARHLVVQAPVIRFALGVGDRILVRPGDVVAAGTPLVERMRDVELVGPSDRRRRSICGRGRRAVEPSTQRASIGRHSGEWHAHADWRPSGELAVRHDGGWQIAAGNPAEVLEAPAAGIVRDARPGMTISLATDGPALTGAHGAGSPARGRLEIAGGPDAELRPSALDVGRAGTILVVGSRVDAETLIRARAMGVRGVIVGGLSEKDLRDFAASERRQHAGLHRPPPFAVLVLDGALRRPIAGPVIGLLIANEGREVGLVADPPCLLLGRDAPDPPTVAADFIRIVHGPLAGREGRWSGLAGLRRFRAGTHLEAGFVELGEDGRVAVPLADLERFV
jgi:hypothetical protein